MKRILLLVLVVCAVLSAAVVPIDRAQKVAENYYQNYAPVALKNAKVQKVLTKEYLGQPTWYVFAFDKGWVIVAAEDNVRPVLGFSFTSPIDEDLNNMNNPFLSRFSSFDRQIVHSIREKDVVVLNKQREWKDIENKVFPQSASKSAKGPLMQDLFHQSYPFNDQCPGDAPVGCVATSFTQVMRFWEGPATGPTILINSDTAGDIQASYNIPVSERTYDWSLMQGLTGGDFETQEQIDEIAKLSLHTGVSVDMDWEVDGSGTLNSLSVIVNDWGFDPSAAFANVGTVTDSTAQTVLIQTEINNNRPILWGGYGATGGHAFVLDGYDVDAINHRYLYHFNWGWGGSYNGWFQLNDLTPGVDSFTEGQDAFYQLEVEGLLIQRPYPQNLAATPTSSGDINLTWDAPTPVTPMGTLVDYYIYKDDVFLAAKGNTTRTYTDPALPEGQYKYTVRAVYTGPDGNSLPSNIAYASVVPNPLYPAPIAFTATSYRFNRQKIDLTWTKPFTGTALFEDGFEVGNSQASTVAGWIQRGSFMLDEPGMTWHNVIGNADPDDQGFVCSVTTAHTGTLSMLTNDWNTGSKYYYGFPEDPITLVAGKGMMTFWYVQEAPGAIHHIVLYNGDFTESDASPYLTVVESVQLPHMAGENVWVGQHYVDLSPYSGTYYIGIVKEQTGICANRYDDFFIGSDSYPLGDQPDGFEVYRDGAIIASVPCTGILHSYEDVDFNDGWNNYYARAVYPGGNYSISGPKSSAFIVANPVPVALAGSYDEVNEEVDLSWYSPGHYPIHWFGWEFENDDWFYLVYADNEVYSARTYFNDVAFDMCYNIYIDSISCAFYEDAVEQPWQSTQFRYAIGTGSGEISDTLHTSPILTANPDGSFIDYDIPGELTISEPWWVEVQFINLTSATPSPMTLVHEEGVGVHFNSVWHYSGDGGEYPEGWYEWTYVSPYECEDFAIYCLGYNDQPTITKTATPVVTENVTYKPRSMNEIRTFTKVPNIYDSGIKPVMPKGRKNVQPLVDDSKALQTYQIWRNDTRYDTSTSTTYTDAAPLPSNTYYITAIYNDPAGESGATNEVTLGPPAYAQMPVSIAKSVSSGISDTGTFDLGNTGGGYLNYTLSYEYIDTMTQPITPVDEHFASSLGTFTSSASWAYSTTTPVYETGYARIVSINNGTRSGYLTSQAFDVSGLVNTKVNFAYLFSGLAGSSLSVQYSTDGTNYTPLTSYTAAQTTWTTASLNIPDTAVRVRFYGYLVRGNGQYAGVDVIQVTGDEYLIDPWFSYVSAVEGTVLNYSSNTITCGYDATNLPDGEYHANVIVDSNDEVNPQIITPVVFTVGGTNPVIPAVPANLTTSVVGGQLVIGWDVSADATEYYVYSSADPYGTYTQIATAPSNTYTYAGTETKMFFYVIAGNATKTAPKTIKIAKPASKR